MKHALLASVAALALTAASTVAFSQGGNSGGTQGAGGGTSTPMANPSGPAGGPTGGAATGRTGGPSTTNPTGDSQSTVDETTPPGAHKGAQERHKGAQDTTSPRNQNQKSSQQAPTQGKSQSQQSQGEQPRGERREQSQTEQRGERTRQQSQTEQRGNGGSRQGAAERPMTSKNVSLTTEQKTTIREKVLTSSAPRVTNVNFDVRVGTVVPRTIRIAPLPTTIVEIEPDWRGYMYFVRGDEIIVVEPGSLRIVAVLDV
jgi:hypothetical protein